MGNEAVHTFYYILSAERSFVKQRSEMLGNASVLNGFLEEENISEFFCDFDGFTVYGENFSQLEHGSTDFFGG